MSNHQPSEIPCSTTAAVFLMSNDSIQMYRCYTGFTEIL